MPNINGARFPKTRSKAHSWALWDAQCPAIRQWIAHADYRFTIDRVIPECDAAIYIASWERTLAKRLPVSTEQTYGKDHPQSATAIRKRESARTVDDLLSSLGL